MDKALNLIRVHLRYLRPILVLCLTACAVTPATQSATLRIAATDLAAPLLSDLASAYGRVNPKVSILPDVLPLDTQANDLAAGRVELALAVTHPPNHFATPLGYVSLAVIVHPLNPLNALSAAQVREIFAGRITHWAQVGGAAGEILVVSREKDSDAAKTFAAVALAGASPTSNALVAPGWPAMRQAVGQNSNAIGYAPTPEVNNTVKRLTGDAEMRALIVALAPQEPTGAARDFLAWAQSEAGQKVVAQKYEAVK